MSLVVVGDPEPYFAVWWGIAKQRLRGLSPVQNFFLELFSAFFFPKILCPPFWKFALNWIFFWFFCNICGCVVYFHKSAFCFVKNISTYFCVNSFVFYISEFRVGGHSSWKVTFFFEFLKFLMLLKHWFYGFIRSIRQV